MHLHADWLVIEKSRWKYSVVKISNDVKEGYPDEIPPEKIPLNVVEREPVPTRVLNPNASEASYKPKQRSYRKTNLKKILAPNGPSAEMSGAEMSSAETAAPKRTRPCL